MKPFIVAFVFSTLLLSACSRTTQTTSGEAWLSAYTYVPAAGPARVIKDADCKVTEEIKSIDQPIKLTRN